LEITFYRNTKEFNTGNFPEAYFSPFKKGPGVNTSQDEGKIVF
jgi:hypothetical protein